ncbi:MAG: SDR family oxidoreductase [Pirellulales bacterium]
MFENRTAVVTGGSSGIGRATALLLAEHGARVFTGDLRPNEANGDRYAPLRIVETACDVRSEAEVKHLVDTAVNATGRLDIVVHSAGIVFVRQIPDTTEAEWDACLDTNFKGAFLLAKHAVPALQQTGGGAITFVSSNAGLLPRAHDPVYSTSKGAVNALAKSLALCHARDKIRVNTICPGPVAETGIIDADLARAEDRAAAEKRFIAAAPLCKAFGRMVLPEEVAAAIVYLSGPAATMITGTMLAIDGGKSLGVPAD